MPPYAARAMVAAVYLSLLSHSRVHDDSVIWRQQRAMRTKELRSSFFFASVTHHAAPFQSKRCSMRACRLRWQNNIHIHELCYARSITIHIFVLLYARTERAF